METPPSGPSEKRDCNGYRRFTTIAAMSMTRIADRRRLLAGGASIHVDLETNRHLDDLRCFPSHDSSSQDLRHERHMAQ
jgi:hypothetical protein